MTQTQPAVGAPGAHADAVPAVALHGLTKRFGAVTAVDGLDLAIQPGEIVAFLGPNGAGKTTTIDMVLGLSRPDAGTVEVFGLAPAPARSRTAWSARCMQTGGLLKDLTVARDRRAAPRALFAHTRPVTEVLERAGIDRDRRPPGRQVLRRPAAAAAVRDGAAARPRADHPRRADDRHGRRGPPRRSGRRSAPTPSGAARSLFATHYLDEADAYADRIVLVSRGRIVADGTAAQIKALVGRPDGPRHLPGADAGRARRGLPGVEDVELRGDTVLVARRRLRRRRPPPAHHHPRPRPRDHLARPRGRLPRPDRRRRPDDRRHRPAPTARVPPLGGFIADASCASRSGGMLRNRRT